jgi:hypothetical protein
MLREPGVRNVFAPANYGIWRRQAPEFIPQRKCAVQAAREASPFFPRGEESLSFREAIRGRKPGNLALDERQLESTDAGWLSGTKYAGQGRPLQIVDLDESAAHLTTKECG